jgi:hypothetical protein
LDSIDIDPCGLNAGVGPKDGWPACHHSLAWDLDRTQHEQGRLLMQPTRPYALLDAVPTIHTADCDSWKAGPNPPGAHIVIDQGLPDEVVGYVIGARRVYYELRRLVGQIAGLLILAQASNRREAFDLPILAAANEVWLSTPEQMERLRAPNRLDAHLDHLKSAHRLLGACLDALKAPRLHDEKIDLTGAVADLSSAYSHLQSASEPRSGMTMVDFSHACCNCGQPTSEP